MISQRFVVMEEIENVWLVASRGEAWWFGWKMGWAMGVVHPTGAVRGAGPRGGAGKGEDYVSIGRRWTGAGRGFGALSSQGTLVRYLKKGLGLWGFGVWCYNDDGLSAFMIA